MLSTGYSAYTSAYSIELVRSVLNYWIKTLPVLELEVTVFFQTIEAIATYNDVINNFYANDFASGPKAFCQNQVLSRWSRISARMIVGA